VLALAESPPSLLASACLSKASVRLRCMSPAFVKSPVSRRNRGRTAARRAASGFSQRSRQVGSSLSSTQTYFENDSYLPLNHR
jgi:hypothetical protein